MCTRLRRAVMLTWYVNMTKADLRVSSTLPIRYSPQVASGLPERSDIRKHVSEIATMALDLLHASSYFKVPYSTNEKVQIRIGIHTGSCGAGTFTRHQSLQQLSHDVSPFQGSLGRRCHVTACSVSISDDTKRLKVSSSYVRQQVTLLMLPAEWSPPEKVKLILGKCTKKLKL